MGGVHTVLCWCDMGCPLWLMTIIPLWDCLPFHYILSYILSSLLTCWMFCLILSFHIDTAQGINSLWTSDAIWRHRSGSTLAQVMGCCLTAPSHYLNHCWLTISKVQWHSSEGNFSRDISAINHWNQLEIYFSKISFKSPRGQWVKILYQGRQRSVYSI